MYRASLQREKMTQTECGNQEQFIERVVNLPLVTTALQQMTSLYNHTKESNTLLRYALLASETSVRVAANTAKPVVSKFEKPIGLLNNFACSQLDKLEENYPIITEPTDKVYNATLKPTVDRIISIRDTGNGKIQDMQGYTSGKIQGVKHVTFKTADGVKHYTVDTVNGVREKGVQRLYGVKDFSALKLIQVINSPYGQVLTSRVNSVLDLTDSYVDYYLPKIEEEDESQVEEKQATPMVRVSTVGTKVCRRLSRRLAGDLKNLQTRSQDSLDKLNFTVNLIDYAKNHIGGVQERVSTAGAKVRFWWDEITREEEQKIVENGEKKNDAEKTLEKRILAAARQVTLTLKSGLETVSSKLLSIPSSIRKRLDQAKTYTEELYKSFTQADTFQDLPQKVVDQVKSQITNLQDALSQVTSYINGTYVSLLARLKGSKPAMIAEPIEMDEFAKDETSTSEEDEKNEEEETTVMTSDAISPHHEEQMNNMADYSPMQ